jgi:hypothetical protein
MSEKIWNFLRTILAAYGNETLEKTIKVFWQSVRAQRKDSDGKVK